MLNLWSASASSSSFYSIFVLSSQSKETIKNPYTRGGKTRRRRRRKKEIVINLNGSHNATGSGTTYTVERTREDQLIILLPFAFLVQLQLLEMPGSKIVGHAIRAIVPGLVSALSSQKQKPRGKNTEEHTNRAQSTRSVRFWTLATQAKRRKKTFFKEFFELSEINYFSPKVNLFTRKKCVCLRIQLLNTPLTSSLVALVNQVGFGSLSSTLNSPTSHTSSSIQVSNKKL